MMDPVTPCSITLPCTTCSFTLLFECYFRLSSELGLSIAHPFVEHFKPFFLRRIQIPSAFESSKGADVGSQSKGRFVGFPYCLDVVPNLLC